MSLLDGIRGGWVNRLQIHLSKFIQPILDGVCAATGWKVTFIAGGPERLNRHRLNIFMQGNEIALEASPSKKWPIRCARV